MPTPVVGNPMGPLILGAMDIINMDNMAGSVKGVGVMVGWNVVSVKAVISQPFPHKSRFAVWTQGENPDPGLLYNRRIKP
jgi:hypothetical protein